MKTLETLLAAFFLVTLFVAPTTASATHQNDKLYPKFSGSLMVPFPSVLAVNFSYGVDTYLRLSPSLLTYAEVGSLGVWYSTSAMLSTGVGYVHDDWFQLRLGISRVRAVMSERVYKNDQYRSTEGEVQGEYEHPKLITTYANTVGVDFGPRFHWRFLNEHFVVGLELFRIHIPIHYLGAKQAFDIGAYIRGGGSFLGFEF